jgi:hypothetical protein
MIKLRNVKSALWLIVVVSVGLSALPLEAAIKQNFATQEILKSNNRQLLTLSLGDIWDRLRRKKGKRGSRDGDGSEKNLCMIAPGKLEDQNDGKGSLVIWGNKPVFLWQGEIVGIEVRHTRSDKLMWSQNNPTTRSVIYQGEPLQPGEDYFWREKLPLKQLPSKQSFRMMKAEDRDRISAELKELESKLKTKGASASEIALEKINYFSQKQLWSDVLREIYSVPNPSPELKQTINQIQGHDFCPQ